MGCHPDGGVYDGSMAHPPREFPPHGGHDDTATWLTDIQRRRAAAPDRDEIQAALTEALAGGGTVAGFSKATGIPRQTLYQGGYDMTRPAPAPVCCCEWGTTGRRPTRSRVCADCEVHRGDLDGGGWRCARHGKAVKA